METRAETNRLLIALGLGILVFLAGLALARAWLPEWRVGNLPDESFYVERFRETADRMGIQLLPGDPDPVLKSGLFSNWLPCRLRGMRRSESVRSLCTGVRIEVAHRGSLKGESSLMRLIIRFSPEGRSRAIWWAPTASEVFDSTSTSQILAPEELVRATLEQLLDPGETLGRTLRSSLAVQPSLHVAIQGILPAAQHLTLVRSYGGSFIADRRPGGPETTTAQTRDFSIYKIYFDLIFPVLQILAIAALFVALLARRRIDLVHGVVLAAVSLLTLLPASVARVDASELPLSLLAVGCWSLLVFVLWSAGESFLRTTDPGFTTSLDALRVGRLGPRGGRALLAGLAVGAALAGLTLTLHTLASALPSLQPVNASLNLPVFGRDGNPFHDGIILAAEALVLLAIAQRLLPPRWVPWVAALAGAVLIPPILFKPWPFEVAADFAILAILVVFCRRYGLTALLTAAISSRLLPAAVFSGLHADWMPATFAVTAGTSAAFLILGLVGLNRSPQVEAERLRPPAFMRRIEEERRLKYEMDLLARMQEGLLPEKLPEIPGWQIAARSILATEAGGDLYDFLLDDSGKLWVAAGDVAGHGYSCAIVQAMTTAALTSLVSPERTPCEVLKQVDRVIRRGGSPRNFASLALLRLDLATGEVVLSNAGHPFPYLSVNGDVAEIPLPGLPLGQGPQREYRDHAFCLPPGSALVFCSDGLIETCDWSEAPYGFDRPREVLRTVQDATAGEMLETLLADWRKHLGSEEPPDDTTVVVLKRTG